VVPSGIDKSRAIDFGSLIANRAHIRKGGQLRSLDRRADSVPGCASGHHRALRRMAFAAPLRASSPVEHRRWSPARADEPRRLVYCFAMRTLLLLTLIAGCSHPASHANPPAPAADPLRADLDVFCSPEAAAKTSSLTELGPYVEPKMHDTELHKALLDLKDGRTSIDQFAAQVRAAMVKAHVESCLTLDKIMAPKPAE
jgi:hypothetical protein